jgi:hypothetical protein
MRFLIALKRGYIHRHILSTLLYVVLGLIVVSFIDYKLAQYPPFLGSYFVYHMFNSSPLLLLWSWIGCLMLPVSLPYWCYVTRDKRLDNVSDDVYMSWELHNDIIRRQRTGCLVSLFDLARGILKIWFLSLTWLFWVIKTVKTFY